MRTHRIACGRISLSRAALTRDTLTALYTDAPHCMWTHKLARAAVISPKINGFDTSITIGDEHAKWFAKRGCRQRILFLGKQIVKKNKQKNEFLYIFYIFLC